MDTLLQAYKIRLDLTPVNYVRSFHETINWKNRLIGIGCSDLSVDSG